MDKIEVIIRSEANYDGDGFHWVAVFPNDPANAGRISYVPFIIKNGNVKQIESFGEMALSWYYDGTKHVKPTVLDGFGVYDAVKSWYKEDGYNVRFRQKLPTDLNKRAWSWIGKNI